MRRQIAAVHGRDVARVEGTKIPRVVPVVEMTAKALQAAHRRERRFQSLDGLQRAGPAEVAGADRRQQVQAEIGGRGAMGQNRPRVLLKVVRRSEEHTSELQSLRHLVCRLLLEKKKKKNEYDCE